MNAFNALPAIVLLALALATAIALAGVGQFLVHRQYRHQDFIAHNEVGGIIIAVSGTLYAVVLGFLTIVVWQHYLDARQLVVMESDADIDAWHASVGLPEAVRHRVRDDMVRYANIMVEHEWPDMRRGTSDSDAAMISMDAIDTASGFLPANMGESNAQVATVQQLSTMHDARQQRIAVNSGGVAGFEWLILLLGAICIIAFCWLFDLKNLRVQFLMTSTIVTIIVSILVLLFELQYPFRSDIGIGPEAWQSAVSHINLMSTGSMPGMRN